MEGKKTYDVIVVGTGFAGSFFLYQLLKKQKWAKKILVLEAGDRYSHSNLVRERRFLHEEADGYFINATPDKPWNFSRAFGGGSNCWYGSTPRMLPEDFSMWTKYGVGQDWPIEYDDLRPYYTDVERIMDIAGSSDSPFPHDIVYPLPPHEFSEPDRLLKETYPDRFFSLPTARSSRSGNRPQCCNNGVCHLCPIDAKFTIDNGLSWVFEDERVAIVYNAAVKNVIHANGVAKGVTYEIDQRETVVYGDLIVLAANAIFNPAILLASGIDSSQTGLGLCEQVGVSVFLELDGIDNFQGSTISTGWGLNDAVDADRRERAVFHYHTVNRALNVCPQINRAFSKVELIVVVEDLRQDLNKVTVSKSSGAPVVEHHGYSEYTQRAIDVLPDRMNEIFGNLPISDIDIRGIRPTESHIQGTTVIGSTKEGSVVGRTCIHHDFDNLMVLGSGLFPTASPSNPTLTISALAMYAADSVG